MSSSRAHLQKGEWKKTRVVLVSYPVLEKKEIDANNNGWRSIYIAFEKYQSNCNKSGIMPTFSRAIFSANDF